jgi:metal-dependent amidase/aminoacylase/carboxypeptidase family protein
MRPSEDFGRFRQPGTTSAMFLLGAGVDHPALHDPRYDFPDALIPVAVRAFTEIVDGLLN